MVLGVDGLSLRLVPDELWVFEVTVPTAHRRFTEWTKAGSWTRVHHAVLDGLGQRAISTAWRFRRHPA
ncbi:hypothetical protein [Actinokineospora cianjurensis]|uniref:Transposase n=1 Tax=Actinokineospora cianjurensis TaxID=585224 RepID=A0A421B5L4_9PSEU|nr:hypothetical protein [Actinokineospora cianjurensis]RLK59701.1 hypothetical protein CLV68_0185 [Actinokineospora cianjurensis]